MHSTREIIEKLRAHTTLPHVMGKPLTGDTSFGELAQWVLPPGPRSLRALLRGPQVDPDNQAPRRSQAFAGDPVWVIREFETSGAITWKRQFVVGGRCWYPNTDFLTAGRSAGVKDWFKAHNTHDCLPRSAKLSERTQALTSREYNSIYLYTSNEGDYDKSVVTPYGEHPTGPGNWAEFGEDEHLNQQTVGGWDATLGSLASQHLLRPFVWLFADDSGAIAGKGDSELRRYVEHMASQFAHRNPCWVLGLEVNEYFTDLHSRVRPLRDHCIGLGMRPLGIHLQATDLANLDTHTAWWQGFDYVLLQVAGNDTSQYEQVVRQARLAIDAPIICAEYNQDHETATEAQSLALGNFLAGLTGDDGLPLLSGLGNGVDIE